MPDTTPIYSFPYPCVDEPVNFTDFETLGDAIDAKLLEVQADADYAVGRYNVSQAAASQAGIAVNVETALTNLNAQYVVPVAGIYLTAVDVLIDTVTTITSSRLRVRLNGTPVYGRTVNWEGGLATGLLWQIPSAPIVAAAGDTISCAFLYQGTGTAAVSIWVNSRLVVRIA